MHVLTKKMGAKESVFALMFWLAVSTLAISAPFALAEWTPMEINTLALTALIAGLGSIYSYLMIVGFRMGVVSRAMQLTYLSVPLAFVFGWLFFDEAPTQRMIYGSVFILLSTALVSTNEKTVAS